MSEQTKQEVEQRTWGETPYFDTEFTLYQRTDSKEYAVSADGQKFYGKNGNGQEGTAGFELVDLGGYKPIRTPIDTGAYRMAVQGALYYHMMMVKLPEVFEWANAHEAYLVSPTERTAAELVLAANVWERKMIANGGPIMNETPEQQADDAFIEQRDMLLVGDILRSANFNLAEILEENEDNG